MSNPNVIKFTNIDSVNSGYKNTSGWFKKEQTSDSPSNREVDRHPILRVKNVDNLNAVSGVIRFNEENVGGPVFEGYDGIKWNSFNNVQAINGVDGLNYKTIVEGENLVNSNDSNTNYYSLFKNITTTIINDETFVDDSDTGTESQVTETIHRLPTFKYESAFPSKQFNLANHNIVFEPNDTTSYKIYVKKNDSWPPIDYSTHNKYSQINNGVKLTSNSYIPVNLSPNFKFYNQEYDTVYINENGYLTFGVGESAFVQNILQNHFSKYRISAMFLNLVNDETSQGSSTYTTYDSDIFIGKGKYGESVITFQNYIHNPGTVNYRIDFQIRLFLSNTSIDPNSFYSDDYYPQGTIQIAYNNNANLTNISPLVGISDSSGYDAVNFTELYFSNLLTTTKRDATTETGIPFLRTFLNIELNDSDSITNLNNKYTNTAATTNQDIDGATTNFKLILDDLDSDLITINDTTYGTSYQEDNYYIKTIDLGNITLQKIAVAIRSDFDYEPKKNNSVVHYSDSTNYFVDKEGTTPNINNTTLDTYWKDIPPNGFIDVSYIYNTSNNKDYFNIYENLSTNNADPSLYNSTIYRIQARYQKQMDMSSTPPTLNNNLILKIIYSLGSDTTNLNGHTLSNPIQINFNRSLAGDNIGPYNYIKNNTDYFSIIRTGNDNSSAKFIARIYDYKMTAETSQINISDEIMRSRILTRRINVADTYDNTYSNNSLTLELLNSNGSIITTNKPTDTKARGEVDSQDLNFFNQINIENPSITENYYLRVTGTHNLGYYGVSLMELVGESSETQVSGVYGNNKFSRLNGIDATTELPLTITDNSLTSNEKIYSITKSDNLLFLMSDSIRNKMRFYNYDFSGAIKSSFITSGVNGVEVSDYAKDQEILDMQFMGDKVLVARKDGTDYINVDIFDFDISAVPSTLTSSSSIPNINKVYMRILTTPAIPATSTTPYIPAINYGLIVYLSETGNNLNLYSFNEAESTVSVLTETPSLTTIINELDNIANFIVLDKDNIFLIGNKYGGSLTSSSGKIIKLSYNTTNKTFTQPTTPKTVVRSGEANDSVNKILYAEKYEDDNGKYIVVFYEEGSSADTGYCISIFSSADLDIQYDQIFYYGVNRVTTNYNNIIFNFKVKYGMILILWQDINSNRYFQSYKIKIDGVHPIDRAKTSIAYSSTDFLMDVVLHNITLNSNQENIYVIIRKYLSAADDTAFQLLIQIQKEVSSNIIIQYNSTTNYLQDLQFSYSGKSIFNTTNEGARKFERTNEFKKLIKDPLPITSNDEQLFFFGFDNTTKKLILEGFGKLSTVLAGGAGNTIVVSNEIVTIGASETNNGSAQLAIADIGQVSNFATTTSTYNTTTTTLSFHNPAGGNTNTQDDLHDMLDSSNNKLYYSDVGLMQYWSQTSTSYAETRKDVVVKMETSMNSIGIPAQAPDKFFTGVLHGPVSLEFNDAPREFPWSATHQSSINKRFLMGIRGTFKLDIYSGDSYVHQNQFNIYAVVGNYQNKNRGDNLKIIKLIDLFLIFYIDWDPNFTFDTDQPHILIIDKFVVSTTDVWTRITKKISLKTLNIDPRYYSLYSVSNDYQDWEYIAINHFMVDDGNTMFLNLASSRPIISAGDRMPNNWCSVKMLDLSIGSTYPRIGAPAVGSSFNYYLFGGPRFTVAAPYYNYYGGGSGTSGTDLLVGEGYSPYNANCSMIHIKWNNKKYIYFLNDWYSNSFSSNINDGKMILIRCEKDDTISEGSEPGNSYFSIGKLNLNFVNFAEGFSIPFDGEVYPLRGPAVFLYRQNLVYKNTSTNKIHIYFMAENHIKFVNYNGRYIENYPLAEWSVFRGRVVDGAYNITLKNVKYYKICRLTIDVNADPALESYGFRDCSVSQNINITDADEAALYGPTLERETFIHDPEYISGGFSNFKMIVDSGSRYIIVGSNITKKNLFITTTAGSPYATHRISPRFDRDVLDFVVYKVKNDGDLIMVCFGFKQRVLSIHIENSNLVLFVPGNSSGEFDSNGQFTKVFKKPISDINTQLDGTNPSAGATEIDLASFSPTIIEPENDTNNNLNYPHFFTHLNSGSNIVYNGGLYFNSDESMYQDNAPTENQTIGLKYNMIVGYSPGMPPALSYGDPKSFGIISFGTFNTESIVVVEDEVVEGSTATATATATVTDTSIAGKLLHFNTQLGNSIDSSFITGRYRNSTFNTNEDDTGIIFNSYNNPISLTTDTANFYVRTNSIPNYEPMYDGNVIKGSWNNELSDNTNANYSIMPQNYGWLTPTTLTENGTYFKIPHTIKSVNAKSVVVGSTNISETFWYIGDTYWNAIMVNPGYYDSTATQNTDSSGYYITNSSLITTNINHKLLTPLGRIGVGVNGVVFYNFSNLERNKNAVKDLKSDIFGGMGDSLYAYHYHSWPVNLEGMLDLGHPDTSVQGSDYGRLPILTDTNPDLLELIGSVTYPKYIYGMTYYFNQIDRSNYDSTTINKFAIKFEPIFKGTIHRFKVRQVRNEYYLTSIDFAGTTTGSEKRRLVIRKIKQGDTIIFNHDATCTKLITITGDVSDPSTAWGNYETINVTDTSFAYTTVTTGDNTITITSHNFNTGDEVIYIKGSAPINGLTTNTKYYIINNSTNTIKLAYTLEEAYSTTPINLTSSQTFQTPYTIRKLSDIKTSTISQIGTAGNDGALTYFNVPYNFDVGFLRYQPSGTITETQKDWGSYIITGSFYEYNVALAGISTEKYYTLTPEGGTIIAGTTSPALTNIKFGDLILFNQGELNTTYELNIKKGSAIDANHSTNALDIYNFKNNTINKIIVHHTNVYTYTPTTWAESGHNKFYFSDHGLNTGDAVFYTPGTSSITYITAISSTGTTTSTSNLETDSALYVVKLGDDEFRLASTNANAIANPPNVLLLAVNGYGGHSFTDIKYLYFAPKSANSLAKTTLYYTTNADVTDVDVTGGSISLATYSRPTEYSFNNTIIRHGTAGNSYCPYTKFTIPNFSDIKVNKLTLTLNSNSNKYEIYGNLNNNRYTLIQKNNIYVKLDVKQTYTVSSSDVNIINNTIKIEGHGFNTGNILTYTQGTNVIGGLVNSRNYYVINIDINTIKLSTSEGLANAETNINFTTTGNGNQTFKISGVPQRYEFYGKYNNTGYYETSSTEKITNLQLFNGTQYIFDVSDSSMSGITLRFSSLNTVFQEVLNYNPLNNKITTDITGIPNNTLLYAFDKSNVTNINILGSTVITVKTAHSQFLTELKLFRDTKYIIDVSWVASHIPKFSTTLPTTSITPYNFPYYRADTFRHDTASDSIRFTVGDDINSLYIYSDVTTDTINKTMGSNYDTKIYSEKIYDLLNEIRVTDLSLDATGDSGQDINSKDVISNIINVKIISGKFEFYGIDQSVDSDHKFDYYLESISTYINTLKLYNNTKYIIKYSTDMTGTDNILKFTSNATPENYAANNITFDDTYDDSIANQISFVVKGLSSKTQTIYAYNGKSEQEALDMTGLFTTSIKAQNPKPINIYTDVNSNKLRFFRNPEEKDYFNGYLDYENAGDYIDAKKDLPGAAGHSPLLGYAFDGHPIYGPLGYDKDSESYNSSATTLGAQAAFIVKLIKSSYTGGNDNNGNPIYIKGSGDLDICNGVFSLTPEFPNGIYHYVCTIELNTDGSKKVSTDSNYGYLNEPNTIVKPAYPYVIGAYKGLPEKSNFNTLSTISNSSTTSAQITTYKMNFKSLKAKNNKYNGSNYPAIDIYTDDNTLQLCPRPHPYIWNFTSEQNEDSFFGKSNKDYGNTISSLKSGITDTKFKAYGNVSKWICRENISKGLAVRLVNNKINITVNNIITEIKTLEVELYDSTTSPNERTKGTAFLGIALNDATAGTSCFICTRGITTVKIGKTLSTGVNCGSYGTLVFSTSKGYVIALGTTDLISADVAIAGYFLEDLTSIQKDDLVLFHVQGNYEFN